jgi:hypothetical protein
MTEQFGREHQGQDAGTKLHSGRCKTPPLPQEKSLCWRFGVAFCRLIAGQIGTFLQQIPSLTLKNRNNAPTLVKSTNLLDFCTCVHRLNGRTVHLTDDPLGHRSWLPEGWKSRQSAQAGS